MGLCLGKSSDLRCALDAMSETRRLLSGATGRWRGDWNVSLPLCLCWGCRPANPIIIPVQPEENDTIVKVLP